MLFCRVVCFSRPLPLIVEPCGASENVTAPEALVQALVLGLELLVVTGISIAALRKILIEKSPIVASMTEKPQILGLYMCLKNNIPICFWRCLLFCFWFFACFVFPFFFLHIGVNLPDSVKNILWLGIRPLLKCATCGHCQECEKITPHRKNITIPKTAFKFTRKFLYPRPLGFVKLGLPELKMYTTAKPYYRKPFCPLF